MDEISAEVLKNLDNEMTKKIFNIIIECYKKGKILIDFIRSKYITILINGNNYWTISILSLATRIFLNAIQHIEV